MNPDFSRWASCVLIPIVAASMAAGTCRGEDGLDALLGNAESPAASASRDTRVPVPAPGEQQAAAAKLRDVFSAEFAAAKTADKKTTLAKTLAQQAGETKLPAERWALLSEALRLATEAGDVPTAIAMLDRIPREFAVAAGETARLDGLSRLASKADATAAETLGREILSLARHSGEAGLHAQAMKAISTVLALARKSRNSDLLAAANRLQTDLREQQREAKTEAAIAEKLEQSPGDPNVCLEAGKFYCFKLGNWQKGLPLLAAGSHPEFGQAAKGEMGAAGQPAAVMSAADRWWEVSENESGPLKAAVQSHAADLYRSTLPALSGLDRARVEKRIAAAAAASRQSGTSLAKRIPGLVLWLDATELPSFEPPIQRETDEVRIAVWRDLSGQGNDAKQSLPAKQPLWSDKAFDDMPGVEFSGSQTLAVQMPCGRSGTILVTLRPKVVGNMRPLGCYRSDVEHVGLCLRSDGSVWAEATMAGTAEAAVRPGISIYRPESRLLLGQTWGKAISLIGGGATATVPFAARADTFPGPWGVGGAMLNQRIEYFTGSLGEILVYDRELTAAEIQGLSGELAAKWHCQ